MAEILPDSRAKETKGSTYSQTYGNEIPTWCTACCRVRGPDVPEENLINFFWLCHNCLDKWGPIAATMIVPDEVFLKEILEERLAKEQREKEKECPSFILLP